MKVLDYKAELNDADIAHVTSPDRLKPNLKKNSAPQNYSPTNVNKEFAEVERKILIEERKPKSLKKKKELLEFIKDEKLGEREYNFLWKLFKEFSLWNE
ncbi:MAG: hypothetical protein CEN90_642 [Parcubacteria group bacterium Licking1014_17]|nr:MAG: hypothetical protein CEN90_642 [Parcubacteria group bacterium Licking1014_17]